MQDSVSAFAEDISKMYRVQATWTVLFKVLYLVKPRIDVATLLEIGEVR